MEKVKEYFKPENFGKLAILLLLIIFLLRGAIYTTIFPLWYAPDEPGHYQTVEKQAKKINKNFKSDLLYREQPVYETRPPVYYFSMAVLGLLPLSKSGIVARAYWLRVLNVLLGLLVVFITYLIAKEIMPENKFVQIGAAFLVAFLPMFNHITASIQSDNLANVFFALVLWLSIRVIRKGFNFLDTLGIIAFINLGLYTKRTTFPAVLLLLALPVFILLRTQAKTLNQKVLRATLLVSLTVFLFVLLTYTAQIGTTYTKLELFSFVEKGFNIIRSDWQSTLKQPITIFYMTFWGDYGWADVPLKANQYTLLNQILLLIPLGLTLLFFFGDIERRQKLSRDQYLSLSFLLLAIVLVLSAVLLHQPVVNPGSTSWMPQARYAFTILPALMLIFAAGIIYPFGKKYGLYPLIVLMIAAFTFDTFSLFRVIIPRYYNEFGLHVVQVKDMFTHISPSLLGQLKGIGLPYEQIQTFLRWRPRLFNQGSFYALLFGLYFLFLAGLLSITVRGWREEIRVSKTNIVEV
jgi:4-amino-4-deoxy-L-arabinose transferase-like glycosyltransferase